jgi:dTDP-4-amino-4,6-dideoxygalactose transaminase
MIDLQKQYASLKIELNNAIQQCIDNAVFIGGKFVSNFEKNLSEYIGIQHTIGCGNGTDALQIALMALNLPKGSKIIVPAFTYIAPVEVIKFLDFEVVFADVDINTYNITLENIQAVYTNDVKAIIVVHLFGQICDIDKIYAFTQKNNIYLIEDNAQALGAEKHITRNTIMTTSFYPTKNLGAYGDGGAIFCNDDILAKCIRKIASHGQSEKYIHDIVGINSRLDTLQAAILQVKLPHLDTYNQQRKNNATYYQTHLKDIAEIELPIATQPHIYHQYTIKVKNNLRDELRKHLASKKIDTIINYPLAAHQQKAFLQTNIHLPNAESLCETALSLPIYPELSEAQLSYICDSIKEFIK